MSSPGRSPGTESLASSPEGNISYTGSGLVTEELSRSCGRGLMETTARFPSADPLSLFTTMDVSQEDVLRWSWRPRTHEGRRVEGEFGLTLFT